MTAIVSLAAATTRRGRWRHLATASSAMTAASKMTAIRIG